MILFELALGTTKCNFQLVGEGCVKQFLFNEVTGSIEYAGRLECGGREAGPRYLEFHPTLNICYLVNELASNVMVYRFDEYRALELDEKFKTGGVATQRIQPNNVKGSQFCTNFFGKTLYLDTYFFARSAHETDRVTHRNMGFFSTSTSTTTNQASWTWGSWATPSPRCWRCRR